VNLALEMPNSKLDAHAQPYSFETLLQTTQCTKRLWRKSLMFLQKCWYSRICLICHLKGIRKKWRFKWSDKLWKQVKNSITAAHILY